MRFIRFGCWASGAMSASLAAALIAGCVHIPTGRDSAAVPLRPERLTVVPLIRNEVSYWRQGFNLKVVRRQEPSWQMAQESASFMLKLMPATDIKILNLPAAQAPEDEAELVDWVIAGVPGPDIAAGPALLIVRQSPIDVAGGEYNPAAGLIGGGPLGLLLGVALRESQYQRCFAIKLPEGLDRRFGSDSQCAVRLQGLLVDVPSRQIVRRIEHILGEASVPAGIRLDNSGVFSMLEQLTLHDRCMVALEGALKQLVSLL